MNMNAMNSRNLNPRNLREMLSAAKDTSELMVDLAYAALYFRDLDMADEVLELEERMSNLVQDMRAVCLLAVRHPKDAEGMASVLQVISAIERIANDAVDITRIVTNRLGIPSQLVHELSMAEEVSHRVHVLKESSLAHHPISFHEMPVQMGLRVMAVRRGREWFTNVKGSTMIVPDDVLFLRGSPQGIGQLRSLAVPPKGSSAGDVSDVRGMTASAADNVTASAGGGVVASVTASAGGGGGGSNMTAAVDGGVSDQDMTVDDLDMAVDVLVEMKNLSEVAVGLAYLALVLQDSGLASVVSHIEARLDNMQERLEMCVLLAASKHDNPSALRGLLHLSQVVEDIGDQALQMVWLVERDEDVHPVLTVALGESEDVVAQVPVSESCEVSNRTLSELRLNIDPGFTVLAIRRGGQYLYRPRGMVRLQPGDELIASGPDEGRVRFSQLCGQSVDDV